MVGAAALGLALLVAHAEPIITLDPHPEPEHHTNSSTRAEQVILPVPQPEHGQTIVNQDEKVTAKFGIQYNPGKEPGDSIEWWERRQAGWRRWIEARGRFPRAKSATIEIYLASLAEGFGKTLPFLPRTRFHFYVADTLNPSIWPVGGGFFVIHAGLLRKIRDERQFAFLMALELAHETLGHNMTPVRAGDVKWEPGSWRNGDFDGWPVEYWAFLVGHDPIERGGFTYSLQQESDALELVYRFFLANAWEYDGINRLVADLLPALNEVPGSSSLQKLHANLATAVRLPHDRPRLKLNPVDPLVNRATYALASNEIERSTLQHYPWMLELVPYRDFVVERGINTDRVRKEYNMHADLETQKILAATRQNRRQSLATELDDFADRTEELYSRDKVPSAELARIYLRGATLLAHHRWADAIANAELGLKRAKGSEPFLWQRTLARQQLGQFNRCISEQPPRWAFFDHRRLLLIVECEFLEGRFTDAARDALEYRRLYPFDIEGAFWETLTEIRLKRALDKHIDEIEAFWGDRPMVRALKIFHLGYMGKLSEARELMSFISDQPFLPQEWGMFEFAQAWLRQTFDVFPDEDQADKLLQLSQLQWPLSHLVRVNLPRDAVQNR